MPSNDTLCGCEACFSARSESAGGFTWAGPQTPGWRYACEVCGFKRCPHHADHRMICTGSNATEQVGRLIEDAPR